MNSMRCLAKSRSLYQSSLLHFFFSLLSLILLYSPLSVDLRAIIVAIPSYSVTPISLYMSALICLRRGFYLFISFLIYLLYIYMTVLILNVALDG